MGDTQYNHILDISKIVYINIDRGLYVHSSKPPCLTLWLDGINSKFVFYGERAQRIWDAVQSHDPFANPDYEGRTLISF